MALTILAPCQFLQAEPFDEGGILLETGRLLVKNCVPNLLLGGGI
jgi:hypothetical protein